MNKKVILIGHFGVGKTSLVKRFVHSQFSEEYITTIGVKIDKKTLTVDGVTVNLLIWDIAGENSQQKVPKSYRLGAHGALYVFDITRPATYENMHQEIKALQEVMPDLPILVMANKKDLVSTEELNETLSKIQPYNAIATSAKTGELVNEAFEELTQKMTK
ncbi:Rab family GTPase [Roseivirga sp.]|jgi:small GTP-binding protein|uniref:Rab family GTPase n=1 Tax=Roseivirga sp. TaxID=1964215 RepID=UPI000D7A3E3D|nr:Rab family GTPase [Roseivirga sp.]MBO6494116.1 GTP-binding protein [Roseivirga sp.]PWL30634.1 MAG: GTP-binding protein [Roseivirga sp. XM-24bin3]